MNTVFRIILDIHKLGSQAVIPCFQGDSGCTIVAQLTESGRPYDIDAGSVIWFKALKSDKSTIRNKCEIINNCIVYDFKKTMDENGDETCQTTSASGTMDCQFELIGPKGATLATPFFNILVNKRVYDEPNPTISESEHTAIEDLVADLQKKVEDRYFHGEDGHTPIKGVDYYTPEEVAGIAEEIRAAIVSGNEVAF